MLLDLSIRQNWRGSFVPDDWEMTYAARRVQEESFYEQHVREGPIEKFVPRHSPHFWGYWGDGYKSSDSDSDSDRSSVGWRSMELDEWSLDPGDGC